MKRYKKNPFLSWIAQGYNKDQVWIPWVNIPVLEEPQKALEWTIDKPTLNVNIKWAPLQSSYIQPRVFSATPNNPVVDRDKVLAWESTLWKDLTKDQYLDIISKNPKEITLEERKALRRIQGRIWLWENPFQDEDASSDLGTPPTADDILKPMSEQTDRDIARVEARKKTNLDESEEIAQKEIDRATARIREIWERRKNTLQASYSSRGFWRSSAASDAILEQQKQIDEMIDTAEKKYRLEQSIRDAQIKGLAGEETQGLRSALAREKETLSRLLRESIEKQQELDAEMNKSFAERIDSVFSAIEIAEKETAEQIDINTTKEVNVWYFTDSEWNVVLDKNWKPIIYKAPLEALQASKTPSYQFVDTKIDNVTGSIVQPAGYFNRYTWQFVPINFGGDSNKQEFQWMSNTSTQTNIAEYTHIYKWSPYNAEWIDLAWKQGSAIKTPITWEVIYADTNWEWGNQVKIKDINWNIHQFSHLENVIVSPWQKITPWTMIWTMGNTWNVVWGNWEQLTPEQISEWRGTHLDYTVYDDKGKKMPLSVPMSYAWIPNTSWNTTSTTEAVQKWYDTATKLKIYNQIIKEWGTPPNLKSQTLNEWQRKSVWFAKRMWNDLDIMKTYYKDLKDTSNLTLAWYRKAFGTTLWNSSIPAGIQQFLQAERDFIQAKLREESWAAIPQSEINAFIQTNGILPWDSDEVIQQKFKNMEIMLEGMIIWAWPWQDLINSPLLDKEDEEFFWNTNTESDNTPLELDQEDQEFFNNL